MSDYSFCKHINISGDFLLQSLDTETQNNPKSPINSTHLL